MIVDINGSEIEVLGCRFFKGEDEEAGHYVSDCYVTFLDGTVTRYDSGDVTIFPDSYVIEKV